MAKQRLADVQCSRLVFAPGDRLLVRLRQPIDKEARCKLHKAVQRWAGDQVEVLIIDLTQMDIEVDKAKEVLVIRGQ